MPSSKPKPPEDGRTKGRPSNATRAVLDAEQQIVDHAITFTLADAVGDFDGARAAREALKVSAMRWMYAARGLPG